MKKVSLEEFFDWIFSQPDDEKLDMTNPRNDNNCGCVMIQYGQRHSLKITDAGTASVYDTKKLVIEFDGLAEFLTPRASSYQFFSQDIKTYKDLKGVIISRLSNGPERFQKLGEELKSKFNIQKA